MTTTLHTAAQQALAALERCTKYVDADYEAIAALRKALAAPQPDPVALESVHLTRDTQGMCVVRVNGRVAIRDNGDIIDHMATLEWFATPPAAPAPAVPAVCDGGTCGLGGYCANCPKQSAAPTVREPQDERIRWRDAVIKEAESALRTAEQEFADMPTWANVGHAAKKVTHALAVIAAHGIGGGGNG